MSPKAAALLALALTAGCGRTDPAPETQRETLFGHDLVVGSSAERWSIASVPRAGGPVALRSVNTPSDTLWIGGTDLPAIREAHALAGGTLALVTEAGEALLYSPAAEALDTLGPVGENSVWTTNGEYGLFTDVEAGVALFVSAGASRQFNLPAGAVWAGPLDGSRIGLLVRTATGLALRIQGASEEAAGEESAADVRGPGVVTAWGRRLVFAASAESTPAVKIYSSQTLEETSSIAMGDPVTALRTSPSSHEMYAALEDPPRVVSVNRFTLSEHELGRTEDAVRDLRSSLFGGSVLAFDGTRIYRMAPDRSQPAVLDGDWRTDLPINHLGSHVLIARGDSVVDLDLSTGLATPVGTSDAIWIALRWRPRPPAPFTQVAEGPDGAGRRGREDGAGVLGAGADTDRGSARPEEGPDQAGSDPAGSGRVTPGYYAIVGSANQEEGIAELVRSLAGAGFPTSVQRFSDDAAQLWYRGLVGPFATRSGAEAAARQLVRERQLQTWVTRVDPSPGSEGSF